VGGGLGDDHDGKSVESFQVHGDGSKDAVILVGRPAHDHGDTRFGAVLAAKFLGDGSELTGDRAVPTLKVPAGLVGAQSRSNLPGQVSGEIVKPVAYFGYGFGGHGRSRRDASDVDDLQGTVAVAEKSGRAIERPLGWLGAVKADDQKYRIGHRAARRAQRPLKLPFRRELRVAPICFDKSTMIAQLSSVHFRLLTSIVVGTSLDLAVLTQRRVRAHDPGRLPGRTDTGWLIRQPRPTGAGGREPETGCATAAE
jgi:hypothetical protein